MNALRIALYLLLLLMATVPLTAQGTYTQIGYPGATATFAMGVNTAGDIVGFYSIVGDAKYHGFLYSGGTYTTIDYPGSSPTYLDGINDVGQIVGQNGPTSGFLYDLQTQTFTSIACPNASYTRPYAINNSGVIAGVVGYHDPFFYGFETSGTTCTHIAPPGTDMVFVAALTAKGGVVGSVGVRGQLTEKYFVFDGSYRSLPLPVTNAQINGVNPAGTAIVGQYQPSFAVFSGFLYQNKTMTTLQFPGAFQTMASGINSAGEVVGTFFPATGGIQGFTWAPSADAPKDHVFRALRP